MQYARVIHPSQISAEDGRPSDLAFKKSSDSSGISCFNLECAISESGSICQHITIYYGEPIGGDPIIYWIIPDSPVLNGCDWVPEISKSGDACHYNLVNLSRNAAQKFVRSQPIDAFTICDGTGSRPLQLSDIIASRQRYVEKQKTI